MKYRETRGSASTGPPHIARRGWARERKRGISSVHHHRYTRAVPMAVAERADVFVSRTAAPRADEKKSRSREMPSITAEEMQPRDNSRAMPSLRLYIYAREIGSFRYDDELESSNSPIHGPPSAPCKSRDARAPPHFACAQLAQRFTLRDRTCEESLRNRLVFCLI